MTAEEIKGIMGMTLKQLGDLCGAKDLAELAKIISCSVNLGINLGQYRTHLNYNQVFRGYKEISIKN